MQLRDYSDKRENVYKLDARAIAIQKDFNGRDFASQENIDHVAKIAGEIESAGGVLVPITVRMLDGKPTVVDGEVRVRACLKLIEEGKDPGLIRCLPLAKGFNEIDLVLQQIVYNSGKPFNPIETASNIRRAHIAGKSEAEIAKILGMSPSWVNKQLAFLEAPQEVHNFVRSGEISVTLAADIMREEGPEKAPAVIAEAVAIAKAEDATKPKKAGSAPRKVKATKKHLKKGSKSSSAGQFIVKDGGGGLLLVNIGGAKHLYSLKFWTDGASRILDEIHRIELSAAATEQRQTQTEAAE